jgi:mandelate racemase
MTDLMRVGDVTGWHRGAAIAGTAGVAMSGHLYGGRGPYDASYQTVHWIK